MAIEFVEPGRGRHREFFQTGVVARFFGHSVQWLQYHFNVGNILDDDGHVLQTPRLARKNPFGGEIGPRLFRLDDIEKVAISLEKKFVIDKFVKANVLKIVDAIRHIDEWHAPQTKQRFDAKTTWERNEQRELRRAARLELENGDNDTSSGN